MKTTPLQEDTLRGQHLARAGATPQPSRENATTHPKGDKKKSDGHPLRKTSLIIGISLLLMAVVAGFAASTTSGLFVLGNTALTALNVGNSAGLFGGAIVGWLATLLLDILVSAGVAGHFKDKKPQLAWLSGGLRMVYSGFLAGAIAQLLKIDPTGASLPIYSHMHAFNHIWGTGLIVFGLHLITLGVLFNPEGSKKWVKWGIKSMLILAGAGYMIEQIGALFVPNPVGFIAMLNPIFIVPMIVGEIALAIWMVAKGGKPAKDGAAAQ